MKTSAANQPPPTYQATLIILFRVIFSATISHPTFADIDGDGDLDLIVGWAFGFYYGFGRKAWRHAATIEKPAQTNQGVALGISLFRNTGGAFEYVQTTDGPFSGISVGYRAAPTFADLDGDADLDMFLGYYSSGCCTPSEIRFFENVGDSVFVQQTGAANPMYGVGFSNYDRPVPNLIDIDSDGDQDLFVGSYGTVRAFENTGSFSSAAFVELVGSDNPLNGVDVLYGAATTFADLDDDQKADLLIGNKYGEFSYYINTGLITSVHEPEASGPNEFGLSQNYPNPFNPNTTIEYNLPTQSKVVLQVFNLLGQEVSTLVNGRVGAGRHTVSWDGRDRFGKLVASGVYIYRLRAGSFTQSRRFMFLK